MSQVKFLIISLLIFGTSMKISAKELPQAIKNYEIGANSENINTYMSSFTKDIVINDVGRMVNGNERVRIWAIREVIPNGKSFKHLKILEQKKGYAKTEVKWMSWTVHYHYWWNSQGKITKMSLQYK